MKNAKSIVKIISFLLIIILAITAFAACGSSTAKTTGNENNTGNTDSSAQGAAAETTEAKILPELPDARYDGYTFTFLVHQGDDGWDWLQPEPREIVAQLDENTGKEVENGDPINDAVYKRNLAVKEKLGIDIAMKVDPNENSTLKKVVQAGDDTYGAVMIYNNNVPGVVTGNSLMEVSDLPYVDLSKPWWDPAVNAMSIAHKQFLLAGDLLILDNEATNAIIFNKDLMANLGMDLPYNLALEGKWTMDKMLEMTKGAEMDLNGDGVLNYKDDRFGFVTFNDTLQALLVAGGGSLAAKDANDIPYICYAEPKNLSILDKAMNLMYKDTNSSVFNVQSVAQGVWKNAYYDVFMENRALFMWIRMRVVEVFRGMESNFGILPMPKYDEQQANYSSLVNSYTGVLLGVPKSASDPERTSVILEALAAESKYTLQPAYYDIVLNRKFVRDEESSAMLDIIFSTTVYDIGGVYSFGSVFSDFLTVAGKEDRNIASLYDKKQGSMQKAIDKVVAQFEAMD